MRRQAAKPWRPLSPWWHYAALIWIVVGTVAGLVVAVKWGGS